jgi:hypothetical protein
MNKKELNILISLFLFSLVFLFSSCQKEVPKELLENNKPQTQTQNQNPDMPNDSIHNNLRQDNSQNNSQNDEMGNDENGDTKAVKLMKEADNSDQKYQQSKSEADKKECINKQLTAANYLMFEANLPSKKKYRPALTRYRRVLELDPSNKEAKENKEQIEEIYESMGMPIPNS